MAKENLYTQARNNFTHYPPHDDQEERYQCIRRKAFELAETFIGFCPESRELSLALTNLEQSMMWANAAIARNEKGEVQKS